MTDYSHISNAELSPDADQTTQLYKRLRDNPIAMTEGAAGAPQWIGEAFADDALTLQYLDPSVSDPMLLGAAALFDTAAGNVTVKNTFNVLSVTQVNAFDYEIVFLSALTSAIYPCSLLADSIDDGGQESGVLMCPTTRTTGQLDYKQFLRAFDLSGARHAYPTNVSVIIQRGIA
jgi:hypothetical protein